MGDKIGDMQLVPLGTAAPAGQIQIVDGCPEGGGAAAISAYEPPAWEAAKGAASEDEDEDDAGEDARLVQPPSPQSPLFPDTALRKGSRPVRRKSLDAAFIKEEAESKRGFLKLIVMLLPVTNVLVCVTRKETTYVFLGNMTKY